MVTRLLPAARAVSSTRDRTRFRTKNGTFWIALSASLSHFMDGILIMQAVDDDFLNKNIGKQNGLIIKGPVVRFQVPEKNPCPKSLTTGTCNLQPET
jgi:hypothetical protein